MNVLGSFGNLYMAALLILLVAGMFYAIYYLIQKIYALLTGKDQPKSRSATKPKAGGDSNMKNNGWLKLALISFVGLIISVVLLNITNPSNTAGSDEHSTHVNGTAAVGGTVQGTISSNVTMDQMNNMMQQMNQLQQQMMQMQQQFTGQTGTGMGTSGSMGSTGSMGSMGSSGSMGNSGSMGSSGGMMDMMNMGNMNNSSSSGSNSSSGGGMGMM